MNTAAVLTLAWRIFVALLTGLIAFFLGLFTPLWTLMLVGKDPGNIAGGMLTIAIGVPLGLAVGFAAGIFAFRRLPR